MNRLQKHIELARHMYIALEENFKGWKLLATDYSYADMKSFAVFTNPHRPNIYISIYNYECSTRNILEVKMTTAIIELEKYIANYCSYQGRGYY